MQDQNGDDRLNNTRVMQSCLSYIHIQGNCITVNIVHFLFHTHNCTFKAMLGRLSHMIQTKIKPQIPYFFPY